MDPLDATNATEPIVDTTFDVYGLINNQCVWGPTPTCVVRCALSPDT